MSSRALLPGAVIAGAVAGPASAATAHREPFGALPDGTAVESIVLTGANGVSARVVIGRGVDHNFVIDAGKTAEPKL